MGRTPLARSDVLLRRHYQLLQLQTHALAEARLRQLDDELAGNLLVAGEQLGQVPARHRHVRLLALPEDHVAHHLPHQLVSLLRKGAHHVGTLYYD